jgi:hypothetical protein
MNRRQIGVWFSAAFLILLLSICVGYGGGVGVAHVRHQPKLWKVGSLNDAEKQQFAATLSALTILHSLRFTEEHGQDRLKSALQFEIDHLKEWELQPGMQPIKPVIDLHLARAFVGMSVVEQRGNDQIKANEYMESGKELLRSLGWQDCSEETLKERWQKGIYLGDVKPSENGAQR